MATSLSVEDRRAWEMDLIQFYLSELNSAGVPAPSLDDAIRLYKQQLLGALAM